MAQIGDTHALKHLLADTYVLYLKTQNYHWNVVGQNFHAYHLFFEEQYKELAEASDAIAERIRALGEVAPATFQEFSQLKTLPEGKYGINAMAMLQDLLDSHIAIGKTLHAVMKQAKKEEDEVTLNLIIDRMEAHEKMAWMLKSHLT
ncbi:MAG: Dps family protein [Candidatus Berkiellales bacterium]